MLPGTTALAKQLFSTHTDAARLTVHMIHVLTSLALRLVANCRDWMGKYQGSSKLALRPSTTDEVSQLLAYCSLRRLAVVPQAGNTGLVGGSVPVFDEIVLNMGNMNKIISFDEVGWPGWSRMHTPHTQQAS